jgi:hypothetical protein
LIVCMQGGLDASKYAPLDSSCQIKNKLDRKGGHVAAPVLQHLGVLARATIPPTSLNVIAAFQVEGQLVPLQLPDTLRLHHVGYYIPGRFLDAICCSEDQRMSACSSLIATDGWLPGILVIDITTNTAQETGSSKRRQAGVQKRQQAGRVTSEQRVSPALAGGGNTAHPQQQRPGTGHAAGRKRAALDNTHAAGAHHHKQPSQGCQDRGPFPTITTTSRSSSEARHHCCSCCH